MSLLNKVAIITGSSRGIGHGMASLLAHMDAKVSICYTSDASTEEAQKLADKINAANAGHACIVQADLAKADAGKNIINGTLKGLQVDAIDILVNNAAISPGPVSVANFDSAVFDNTINVNVKAPMLLVQALLPYFTKSNGRIINVSSLAAAMPVPNGTVYAVSKAAIETLTRQWAVELPREYNCTVNCVRIGPTVTAASEAVRGQDSFRDKARASIIERTSAAPRLGEIEDHAQVIAWLASEGSRWLNGQVLNSNGGVVFH